MEQHHPGAKEPITDLKRALHNEWDKLGSWTGGTSQVMPS